MSALGWLGSRTIFLGVTGSHAYGTSGPESDVDVRGVAVAPMRYYLGCSRAFEQADALPEGYWSAVASRSALRADLQASKDVQVMDVRKFMKLASDCNPNIVEILWLQEPQWALATPAWHVLVDARRAVLSKRARFTFAGYAHSQLKRINTHRRWLLEPPKAKPSRSDFALPERLPIPKDQYDAAKALVDKRIQSWTTHPETEIPETMLAKIREAFVDLTLTIRPEENPQSTQYLAAGASLGIESNFMEQLDRERRYRQALAWFHQYEEWKANRNPARAEMEAHCGYDVKHAAHLVRLLRMACEILRDGEVIVRRPDAAELLEIRRGGWSFDRLLAESERLEKEAERLYATTMLPRSADAEALDDACLRAISIMRD